MPFELFPVLGDFARAIIELDASQVLTFPQTFGARGATRIPVKPVVRNCRHRHAEHVKEILEKLPTQAGEGQDWRGNRHAESAGCHGRGRTFVDTGHH